MASVQKWETTSLCAPYFLKFTHSVHISFVPKQHNNNIEFRCEWDYKQVFDQLEKREREQNSKRKRKEKKKRKTISKGHTGVSSIIKQHQADCRIQYLQVLLYSLLLPHHLETEVPFFLLQSPINCHCKTSELSRLCWQSSRLITLLKTHNINIIQWYIIK